MLLSSINLDRNFCQNIVRTERLAKLWLPEKKGLVTVQFLLSLFWRVYQEKQVVKWTSNSFHSTLWNQELQIQTKRVLNSRFCLDAMVTSSLSFRLLESLVGISTVVLLAFLSAHVHGLSSSSFFKKDNCFHSKKTYDLRTWNYFVSNKFFFFFLFFKHIFVLFEYLFPALIKFSWWSFWVPWDYIYSFNPKAHLTICASNFKLDVKKSKSAH